MLASDALAGLPVPMIAVYDVLQLAIIMDVTDLTTVTMTAGEGYWVYTTEDAVWTVDW